jgi:hypothetical protein
MAGRDAWRTRNDSIGSLGSKDTTSMTFTEYQRIQAVNWSTLKAGRTSALHYKHRVEHPLEDSTVRAMGRGAHTAVFEPDRFALEYAVFEGPKRAGNDWDAFCAANPGRTILKSVEYLACLRMRDAVRSHAVAGPLLMPPGEAEKVITWTDDATGLPCKGRLDWYRPGLVCDLKTTYDIGRGRFAATVARMGYHGQAAFYRAGLRANGLDVPPFRFIAVEQTAPHDVAVYQLDDDALYAGEQDVDELLRMVSAGRFSGQWPGQYQEEQMLSLPAWAFTKTETEPLGITIAGEEA